MAGLLDQPSGGLLDWIGTPAGQGLLTAVAAGMAGARRGAPVNTIGAGLLGGLQGYANAHDQQSLMAARKDQADWTKMQRDWMMQDRARVDSDRTQRETWLNQSLAPKPMMTPSQAPDSIKSTNPYADPSFLYGTAKANGMAGLDQVQMGVPQINPLEAIRNKFSPEEAAQLSAFTAPRKPNIQTFKAGEVARNMDTGEVVFQAPEKQPEAPSAVREYQFAVAQGYKGSFEQWATSQKRAGATNVNLNTDKTLTSTIAKGLGEQLDSSLAGANAAVNTISTANQIRDLVSTGKIVTGPGADYRIGVMRLGDMLGVGGKDNQEKLANTAALVQSLAKTELEAAAGMKGQGQITEAERAILRRAAGGDLNMTSSELITLSNAMDKTARSRITSHQTRVQQLKAVPGADSIIPFYSVQMPGQYKGGAKPTASTGRTVVRTGTMNGRKVVQYSDGSTEYAD